MKYLKIIVPVVFLLMMNCAAQNKTKEFDKIAYEAQTRGSLVQLTIEGNKLSYKTYQKEGTKEVTKEQLEELKRIVNELNLDKISDLKAPSEKRITDGALHAEFTIKIADKEYKSSTFDAGNPPKELKKLEDLLYSLSDLKE
ncbi:hypothetical protein [Tenacibaculum discolor]|uniref:Lipoprotein n=1 Tax=Tenacibaculum discolor TaxID=361581 RepID=A0A2G1BUT9_9FLAO|nr:hypothetical protein [Tenacibaculum discolor]MDP2542885.1 hypothetical protein [Tenacibaculum discolor]PHN97812.1 hypothetical protein CSC81_05210 [Tenacibaculum discolor]PHO01708.1 hypothetical protein CSC82_22210 [Rhodobacteraceae bacterium 4F10]RLJ96780.1 hypothetical protein C8N27_3040 [Tenacibaculum discolor]